jgi:ribonuclease P protein component
VCPRHEKNISTQRYQTEAYARFPGTHEHPWRAAHNQGKTRKRPDETQRLNRFMPERKDAGFARKSRLVRPAEFKHVFQQPNKSSDKALLILARRNTLGYARLGLAVSIKSAVTAVERNRVKRVSRESFRQHKASLGGMDFIVTGRAGLTEKTNQELRAGLERHWLILVNAKNPDISD